LGLHVGRIRTKLTMGIFDRLPCRFRIDRHVTTRLLGIRLEYRTAAETSLCDTQPCGQEPEHRIWHFSNFHDAWRGEKYKLPDEPGSFFRRSRRRLRLFGGHYRGKGVAIIDGGTSSDRQTVEGALGDLAQKLRAASRCLIVTTSCWK
jgi:hypothetical protein